MKTLTCLGTAVSIELDDQSVVELRGALLFDDSGGAWPQSSLLIMPFQRTGKPVRAQDVPRFSRDWLQKEQMREGRIALPPRDLASWTRGRTAHTIFYRRSGSVEGIDEDGKPTKDMDHTLGTLGGILGRLIPIRFTELPVLYRRGGAARLDLESGASYAVTADGIIT